MLNLVERRVQAETVDVEVSGWVARALDSFGAMPEAEPLRVARSDVDPASLIMVKRTEHGAACPVTGGVCGWPPTSPTDWLQLVNQPQTEAEVAALRCCVNRGRPFGDPNWVTDTAKRLGLECTVRPRGRPKKQS